MDDFSQCMVSNTRMAARAMTRRYDAYLRPFGVTATQFSLLGGLSQMPGATVSEIADERGFDRTTLTRNLDRLEEMGLVERRPHATDRRIRLLRLTEAAHPKLADIFAVGAVTRGEAVEGVSEADRDRLFDILLSMKANLIAKSSAPVGDRSASHG